VLANRGVSAAVVGTTRLAHLKDDLAASGLRLAPQVMAQIEAVQGRRRLTSSPFRSGRRRGMFA